MGIFAIFKTEKGTDQAQFAGQVSDPLTIQKVSQVSGMVTGGEKRTSIKCCDGNPATVVTENHYIDFVPKQDARDILLGKKPDIDL